MKAEIERQDEQAAGVWRFREDVENNKFYSSITYYDSEGDNLIPVTKIFIREKPGSKNSRKRRESRDAGQKIPTFPSDVEVGEIGPVLEITEIMSEDGELLGSCDNENICSCIDGYKLIDESDCIDIDECIDEDLCGDETAGFCFNEPGSYQCQCNDGFEIVNGTCKDIDECSQSGNLCSGGGMKCENLYGSYYCTCENGFVEQSIIVSGNVLIQSWELYGTLILRFNS